MRARVDVRCLSPFEWAVGWMKGAFAIGLIVLIMGILHFHSSSAVLTLAMVLAPFFALVGLYLWPSTVSLLEDGVAIKRYGFTRFIPYSNIREAETLQRLGLGTERRGSDAQKIWWVYTALRLRLADGETVTIGTDTQNVDLSSRVAAQNLIAGAYGDYGAFDRKSWTLKREIDERLRDARNEPRPTPTAAGLMRGTKSIAEWLGTIDAAAPTRGDAYRGSDGTREALWRVLEDGDAPREARAGAALALRAQLDDDGRERMRVVVDACESPKLRVALETALDDEAGEPRILHALEQASLPRGDE